MSWKLPTITIQTLFKIILLIGFIMSILLIFGLIKDTTWNFQKFITIFAIIILVLSLIFIGVSLGSSDNISWPPNVPNCPDYFVDVTNNVNNSEITYGSICHNPKKLGTCGKGNFDFTNSSYTGSSGLCAKYNWATGCGVSWDGITYGVDNPCVSNTDT